MNWLHGLLAARIFWTVLLVYLTLFRTWEQRSPLCLAIVHGDIAAAKALLEAGHDPEFGTVDHRARFLVFLLMVGSHCAPSHSPYPGVEICWITWLLPQVYANITTSTRNVVSLAFLGLFTGAFTDAETRSNMNFAVRTARADMVSWGTQCIAGVLLARYQRATLKCNHIHAK